MDLKKFLLGLILFIIPIILIILIYRFYIYKICHHNEQCVKKKLMYNLDDISNYLKGLVSKQEKEEQIEGFFSGIVDWFYPNPASVSSSGPADPKIEASNVRESDLNPLQNNNLETSPLSGENKDSNNSEFLKSLNDKSKKFNDISNTKIRSISDIDNLNKKLESEIKNKVDDINTNNVEDPGKKPTNFIEKNAKNDTIPLKYETNNPKNLYSPIKMEKEIPLKKETFDQNPGTEEENIRTNNPKILLDPSQCNFYHDVCPSNFVDLGNFSLGGVEKNITLNCGDVQNTKPAKAVAVIKNNEVNDVIVSDKGQGFNPEKPPKVEVIGGGGRGAELEATIDDDGYLKIIKVIHPGYNYNETPNVIIESPMMNSSCHLCCKK